MLSFLAEEISEPLVMRFWGWGVFAMDSPSSIFMLRQKLIVAGSLDVPGIRGAACAKALALKKASWIASSMPLMAAWKRPGPRAFRCEQIAVNRAYWNSERNFPYAAWLRKGCFDQSLQGSRGRVQAVAAGSRKSGS